MKLTYHPCVQHDLDEAVDYYLGIRADLADDFWDEAMNAFYEILPKRVRVVVVRHDRRNPSFGLRRE